MISLMSLSEQQRKILEILLKKYESSQTFKGQNKVEQKFSIKPNDVFPEYYDDFTEMSLISLFEEEIEELASAGLVSVVRKNNEIISIIANKDAIDSYPALLGVVPKLMTLNEAEGILRRHMNGHPYVRRLCEKQLERISDRKKPDLAPDNNRLDQILQCLDYILNNDSEILERELSIELFGDSKLFEKTIKSRVCSLLAEVIADDDFFVGECEKSIRESEILEHFMVVKNPQYFYFKGNCEIRFSDGATVSVAREHPIALCSSSIRSIIYVETPCHTVMTVENLTSFNRMQDKDTFFVYLSGYNNSSKTQFLKKLYKDNSVKNWFHFGDIDPDGFFILSNLRKKTGINFSPYLMGIDELEKHKDYCKSLEPNDITKANSLIQAGIYPEIMDYLLKNNCKLEQEIISWKLAKQLCFSAHSSNYCYLI